MKYKDYIIIPDHIHDEIKELKEIATEKHSQIFYNIYSIVRNNFPSIIKALMIEDYILNHLSEYKRILPKMRVVAKEHGYALAVHGSQKRDLDLIACPWIDQPSSPSVLAEALRKSINGIIQDSPIQAEVRSHHRISWVIQAPRIIYIDLNIIIPEIVTGST